MKRRHFVRQTALAMAACGLARSVLCKSLALSGEAGQDGHQPSAESINKLASAIAGSVVTPDSAGYDTARSIFNRAFDRRPALIVRCARASDVGRALGFAQSHNLPLAIRAGGRSRLGYGICDRGL